MSVEIDFKIAKDYLARLPAAKRKEIINGTLGQEVNQKERLAIRKFCSEYISKQIKSGKI